nr:unnamed protein product [Callosobruchus chinensis]
MGYCILIPLLIYLLSIAPVLSQEDPNTDKRQNYTQILLEGIYGMGFRLQKMLDNGSPNFVISPLSTVLIIGQLMLGAEGYGKGDNKTNLPYTEFHLELSELVKTLQERRGDELFKLDQNNALFYSEAIKLNEQFQMYIDRFYDTEIKSLDFKGDAKSVINNWAANNTNGIINNILTTSPPPSTTSILLNSIYFKAEWEQPFSDQLNKVDKFNVTENTTVDTTFMMNTFEKIPFIETNDFRLLCLPYKGKELGLYILYPTKDHEHKYNIKEFLQGLRPELVQQALSNLQDSEIIVKIPKLSLSNNLNILEPLQKYVHLNKEQQASYKEIILTYAADDSELRVSNIVQQMVFSINEKGTEAAAVSASTTDYIGGQKVVALNRPFCFFVRHEPTSATIFWGTISDPSKN